MALRTYPDLPIPIKGFSVTHVLGPMVVLPS
jgi:hypothetical protein